MIDNQFIKKPSGFNKQRLDSFVRSVKTNKQDVQKKELDEALDLHTQLVAQDMMQRAMQLPPFEDLKQAYREQAMSDIPKAAYGMEIGAVMPSINTPFTYPSQQNITPPNSDMFKKNADAYANKGMNAFKSLLSTTANAIVNPAIQKYNQDVYAKQQAAQEAEDDLPEESYGGSLPKAQKGKYDENILYVSSENDPAYIAFNDSLDLYSESMKPRLTSRKSFGQYGSYGLRGRNVTDVPLPEGYTVPGPIQPIGQRITRGYYPEYLIMSNPPKPGGKDYRKKINDIYKEPTRPVVVGQAPAGTQPQKQTPQPAVKPNYNRPNFDIKSTGDAAIDRLNQQLYGPDGLFKLANGGNLPEEKMGGDLIKAQTLGEIGNSLKAAYDQAMANLNSDEPVYNEAGDLIDRGQLRQAAKDAYNKYYESVAQAYKDNPTPNWQATDFSYLNQYPTMPGLDIPGYNLSGEGIAPELYKGTAAAQMYTNMQADYPGLGRYFGLSPQKNLELGDVNYSPNYKAMYNDALSKGQYDRFETNIEANPTLAGKALDKIGIGKLFSTRNYDVTQNILPQGQSVLDPERLAETQRRQTLLKNADLPGGGLFQTDEMDPYIWENRSRRDRRDVLESAGIDPSRKNLRRLGEDYFENLKQDRVREEAEASREGYENKLASEEAAIKSGAARGSIGNRPRNPYDLMGTGVQSVAPAPAVTGPTNVVVPPAVTPTQPNVVTPNSPTNPANKPRIYGMGRGDAASRKQYENNIMTPDDALASRFQRFEREEGSASGTGLDNYGWNNLPAGEKQPTNIREATDLFQRTYGAKAKSLGITNNDASTYVADYMFNSGRKPEDFLLYASGKVSLADVNGTASLDAQWQANKDQILQDINSGKISMETLAQKRDDILKTTRPKAKPTNPNDPNTATPSDAYINSWQKRAALPVQNLPIADYYPPTKKEGGTMLPMFQVDGEYPGYGVLKDIYDPNFGVGVFALPSADSNKTYSSIDWEPFQTGPLAKKKGSFFNNEPNKFTLGLPELFPDADKMQTFFDTGEAPLTGEAFGKQLDQYVPKYTGQEPQQLATATGKAKLRGNIAPTTYLTIGNTAGKYLADNVFGRDERKRAEQQYRASRFLENNLALTAADTQFDPRLRGFDRTTDAFGGAPYAGAQVQYGQPLIARGQMGTEIPITMQEGGVYTLTPEMIKQIIDNGGEIEYVDNSNNFVNPFNQ